MTKPEIETLVARVHAGEYNNEVRSDIERALGMLLRDCSEFEEERAGHRAELAALTAKHDEAGQRVDESSASDDEAEADADAAENEEDFDTDDDFDEDDEEAASTKPRSHHKKKGH